MRIITFTIFLLALTSSSYSQNYYKLIGDTSCGLPGNIKKCTSGGYILCNTSYLKGYNNWMASVCRLDSVFNVVWDIYLPDGQQTTQVEEASNGDFYIISTNGVSLKNEISRIDPAGNIIWRKDYTNANPFLINYIWSTTIDKDDNLYLVYESNQANRGLFAKIDSAGNILWYNGFCTDLAGGDAFKLIHMSADSCLYILGSDVNILGQTTTILIKSDLNGNIRRVLEFPRDFDDFTCLPNGEILISTFPNQTTALPHSPLPVIRIDSSGHALSTINIYSQDYVLYETSMTPVNGTTFQLFGYAISIPSAAHEIMPYKLTMDTAGHVLNSVMYIDTTIIAFTVGKSNTSCPDLSVFSRNVDGIEYQGLIFDPDTNGICISAPLPIDSVFLDYTTHLDTLSSVILPTNRFNTSLTGTTIVRNFSQDGCLVTQTGDMVLDEQRPLVFPNPFDNQIQFSIPVNDEFLLELYDISGKLIYNRNVKSDTVIDTRNYRHEVYFYMLRNTKNCFTGKIIK